MLDVHSVNDQQAEGTDMIANIDIAVDASLETYKFVWEKVCQMIAAHNGIICEVRRFYVIPAVWLTLTGL